MRLNSSAWRSAASPTEDRAESLPNISGSAGCARRCACGRPRGAGACTPAGGRPPIAMSWIPWPPNHQPPDQRKTRPKLFWDGCTAAWTRASHMLSATSGGVSTHAKTTRVLNQCPVSVVCHANAMPRHNVATALASHCHPIPTSFHRHAVATPISLTPIETALPPHCHAIPLPSHCHLTAILLPSRCPAAVAALPS